jgi:hypothetical protein
LLLPAAAVFVLDWEKQHQTPHFNAHFSYPIGVDRWIFMVPDQWKPQTILVSTKIHFGEYLFWTMA